MFYKDDLQTISRCRAKAFDKNNDFPEFVVEGAGLAAVFLAGLCKSWDTAQYVRYTPENNYSIIEYSNTIIRKYVLTFWCTCGLHCGL